MKDSHGYQPYLMITILLYIVICAGVALLAWLSQQPIGK